MPGIFIREKRTFGTETLLVYTGTQEEHHGMEADTGMMQL